MDPSRLPAREPLINPSARPTEQTARFLMDLEPPHSPTPYMPVLKGRPSEADPPAPPTTASQVAANRRTIRYHGRHPRHIAPSHWTFP